MRDVIEFYEVRKGLLAIVHSAMVPPEGSYISIKGKTFTVTRITYALDHSDDVTLKAMRANVDLQKIGG